MIITFVKKHFADIVIFAVLFVSLFLSIRATIKVNRIDRKVDKVVSEVVSTNKKISKQLELMTSEFEVIENHFYYIDNKLTQWTDYVYQRPSIEINNNNAKNNQKNEKSKK